MEYLAHKRYFMIPQYSIPSGEPGYEWSCPDFVAIKPANREIVVVEVTTAYDISNLARKVIDRNNQWFDKLRAALLAEGTITPDWQFRVMVFCREERVEAFSRKIGEADDVMIEPLEKSAFPWKWEW